MDHCESLYSPHSDSRSCRLSSPHGQYTISASDSRLREAVPLSPASAHPACCMAAIADLSNSRIRRVTHSGMISTVAVVSGPVGVDVDAAGNLYVSLLGSNLVRMVSPTGTITTIASTGSPGYSGDVSWPTPLKSLCTLGQMRTPNLKLPSSNHA